MLKSNPTHKDIDNYITESFTLGNITNVENIVHEIEYKLGVNALLHPSEDYFLTAYLLTKKSLRCKI